MEERTLHFRPPVWLPILIALILGMSFVAGKKVEVRGARATISVSGDGKVMAVPDIASLSFGVQTGRQKTAEAAMDILSKDMNAIIAAIEEEGIEEKDITTESLRLNPAYDWDEGTRIPRGFEAYQSLRVKIRDLEKVGTVLSRATAAGANQAGGVSFTIDDPDALRAEARKEAIAEAQKKARILATDLGLQLGKLKGFNEGGGGFPPIAYMERTMMMDAGGAGAPTPVPVGEQEVRVSVTLTYEVK